MKPYCSVLLAGFMAIYCQASYAGVAFLETARGDGQWMVAASADRLNQLIEQWSSTVSYRGSVQARIRCESKGWVASFYDNQAQSTGVACGSASREEAERAALRECRGRGGTTCRRVFSGYDDASWTDPKPGNGQYRLKDIQD